MKQYRRHTLLALSLVLGLLTFSACDANDPGAEGRIHVLLTDAPLDDVAEAYRVIRGELAAYGGGLEEKAEIVGLNKVDALDSDTRKKKLAALKKAAQKQNAGAEVLCLSGVSGEGIDTVVARLWQHIAGERRRRKEDEESAKASGVFRP